MTHVTRSVDVFCSLHFCSTILFPGIVNVCSQSVDITDCVCCELPSAGFLMEEIGIGGEVDR